MPKAAELSRGCALLRKLVVRNVALTMEPKSSSGRTFNTASRGMDRGSNRVDVPGPGGRRQLSRRRVACTIVMIARADRRRRVRAMPESDL
jgi:hypothetical protein